MIVASEIHAIANWIDRNYGDSRPEAVGDWFEARTVDELAVIEQAARYSSAARVALGCGEELDAAFVSVFVIGFQLGLDAERRRRDSQELPP